MGVLICSPRADRFASPASTAAEFVAPLLPVSFDGTVAILDNGKFGIVGDTVERVVQRRGATEVLRLRPGYPTLSTEAFLDELAPQLSGAIVGLGACGSCTAWSCHAVAGLQRRGVGARVFVLDAFSTWARAAVSSYGGDPDAVVAAAPGLEWLDGEALAGGVDDVLDRMAAVAVGPT